MGFKGLFPKLKTTPINVNDFIKQYSCKNIGIDYLAFCYFIEGIQKEVSAE